MRSAQMSSCVAALALLSGCVRPVSLPYMPPPHPTTAAQPLIGAVVVIDERTGAPGMVGAVMGPDGKRLKTLAVAPDAANAVEDVLHKALLARNEITPDGSGPYALQVQILALDGQQWADRQAEVDLVLRLLNRRTGREVYVTRAYAERRGDNYLAEDNQFLGSPAALARVEAQTLASAIDRALDRTGFAVALK